MKQRFDRLHAHLEEAIKQPKGCNLHKSRTIKQIIDSGLKVITCTIRRADKKEGCLTNLTDGGEGFRGWSNEQKEYQRKAVSKTYEEKYGALAPLIKEKIGSASRGKKQSAQHIAARAKAMIGKNVGNKSIGQKSRERQLGKTLEELLGKEKARVTIEKRKSSLTGMLWFDNGTIQKKFKVGEQPQGFFRGRLTKRKENTV